MPNMTSNNDHGIVITASSEYTGRDAYKVWQTNPQGAANSNDNWSPNNSVLANHKTKFPYQLKDIDLRYTARNYNNAADYKCIGDFYADTAKTRLIGKIDVQALTIDGVLFAVTLPTYVDATDTIYFDKTGGGAYGGIGRLNITAQLVPYEGDIWYYKDFVRIWDGDKWIEYDGVIVGSADYNGTAITNIKTEAYSYDYFNGQLLESWSSGDSRYDLFVKRDKNTFKIRHWVEQSGFYSSPQSIGGKGTREFPITLLVEMADRKYHRNVTAVGNNTSSLFASVSDDDATSLSFNAGIKNSNDSNSASMLGVTWEVKGYAA
jgi:hypothetical protein